MRKNLPSRGQVYTYAEICELDLDDDPHLCFDHEGKRGVVQSTHVDEEALLAIPGFSDTKWRYIRTTHEWIPIFESTDVEALVKCVDLEPGNKSLGEDYWWVTPKGHPREQYVWED